MRNLLIAILVLTTNLINAQSIRLIQEKLIEKGYDCDLTNILDEKTTTALNEFKRHNGIIETKNGDFLAYKLGVDMESIIEDYINTIETRKIIQLNLDIKYEGLWYIKGSHIAFGGGGREASGENLIITDDVLIIKDDRRSSRDDRRSSSGVRISYDILFSSDKQVSTLKQNFKQILVEKSGGEKFLCMYSDDIVLLRSNSALRIYSSSKLKSKHLEKLKLGSQDSFNNLKKDYYDYIDKKKRLPELKNRIEEDNLLIKKRTLKEQGIDYQLTTNFITEIKCRNRRSSFDPIYIEKQITYTVKNNKLYKAFSDESESLVGDITKRVDLSQKKEPFLSQAEQRLKLYKCDNILYIKPVVGNPFIFVHHDYFFAISSNSNTFVYLNNQSLFVYKNTFASECCDIADVWYQELNRAKAIQERKAKEQKEKERIAKEKAEIIREMEERIAQREADEKRRIEELRLDKLRNPEKYAKIEREEKLEEQRRIDAARRYEEEWRKERDASKFKSEQDVISYLNGGDFISTVFKIKIRLDSYGNRMFVYVGGKKSYTVDRISIFKDGRASVFLREHPYGDIVTIIVDKFNDILQYQGVNHSKVN